MSRWMRFLFYSHIGRKFIMALTGLGWVGFLVIHLSGNTMLFGDGKSFNHYSAALTSTSLIYLAELILLAMIGFHATYGIVLVLKSLGSRSKKYIVQKNAGHTSRRSFASLNMIYTGLLLLLFIIIHLMSFKYGLLGMEPLGEDKDLYTRVLKAFQNFGWVLFYLTFMVVLGLHLWHGFGSAFESLGIRFRKGIQQLGHGVAVILAGGFFLIPIILFIWK